MLRKTFTRSRFSPETLDSVKIGVMLSDTNTSKQNARPQLQKVTETLNLPSPETTMIKGQSRRAQGAGTTLPHGWLRY